MIGYLSCFMQRQIIQTSRRGRLIRLLYPDDPLCYVGGPCSSLMNLNAHYLSRITLYCSIFLACVTYRRVSHYVKRVRETDATLTLQHMSHLHAQSEISNNLDLEF